LVEFYRFGAMIRMVRRTLAQCGLHSRAALIKLSGVAGEKRMVGLSARPSALMVAIGAIAVVLAGCAGTQNPPSPAFTGPPPKPSISPSDVIGRWGLGAYHREEDRARTEAITKGQCKQPYVISAGNGGGLMMLTHDSPNIVEVQIKANQDGRTFIGPGAAPGGQDDREVVSYDGRVLILKWVDPEVAGRYGTQILVRCAPKA
jgi:hypothetical protein